MVFELTSPSDGVVDWHAVKRALLGANPFVGLEIQPQHGRIRVEGGLDRAQVVGLLRDAGFDAVHLPHERGGSTCCGGCG